MAIDSSILIRIQKTRQNTAGFFMMSAKPVSGFLFISLRRLRKIPQILGKKKTREITAEFDFLILFSKEVKASGGVDLKKTNIFANLL